MVKVAVTQKPNIKSQEHGMHVANGAAKGAVYGSVLSFGNPIGTVVGTTVGAVAGHLGGQKEMTLNYQRGYKDVKEPTWFNREMFMAAAAPTIVSAVLGTVGIATGGIGLVAGAGLMAAGGYIGKNRMEMEATQAQPSMRPGMYTNSIQPGAVAQAIQRANGQGVGKLSNKVLEARAAQEVAMQAQPA